MATKYKQPKKLNPISILLLLAAAGLVYCGFQFGPPYWRQNKVKGVLKDAAVKVAKWGKSAEAKTTAAAVAKIREIGVEDQALRIAYRQDGEYVDAWAIYVEVIKHPFIKKRTTMRFSPKVRLKRGGF